MPSYGNYLARQEKRLKDENLQAQLPFGWPEQVTGPQVWDGRKFVTDSYGTTDAMWVVNLEANHISDLERGLEHFATLSVSMGHITRDTFPLGEETAQFLRACSQRLHSGNGFLVLRGLDPEQYTLEDNMIIYAGIMAWIGGRRGLQNRDATEVIAHVTDTGTTIAPHVVSTFTGAAQVRRGHKMPPVRVR